MNILILYNSTQTFTNTVYEHLASFGEYSSHSVFYCCHSDPTSEFNVDLGIFDAVGIHYSIRLPFDQLSDTARQALEVYKGLKFLFIQDEYDFPQKTYSWIQKLRINLVFTVVPERSIEKVYPKAIFPDTRFVTNLTGYVPVKLPSTQFLAPPSQRKLFVGYRGRPLPIRYGELGTEKIKIAQIVKTYCDQHDVKNDIAWSEESRIYGPKWYEFVTSCRSMLGTESGSNVFDWDGTLNDKIRQYRRDNLNATDENIYKNIIQPLEIDGLINQISPRIFEAIASKTVLILFEGAYSGVIRPGEHFIALKKDGSNIADVLQLLNNDIYIDTMVDRALNDVILSGRYSYKSFIEMVDREFDHSLRELGHINESFLAFASQSPTKITTYPIRVDPPKPSTDTIYNTFFGSTNSKDFVVRFAHYFWERLPGFVRFILKPILKRLLVKG